LPALQLLLPPEVFYTPWDCVCFNIFMNYTSLKFKVKSLK